MKGLKINIFIFSFLMIFSFLACSHITESESEEDFQALTQNSDRTFNISGTITTQDEYSSRTAFPSVPKFAEGDAEKFIVKATLKSDETVTILGKVTITGTSAGFSIQLPNGDWKIAVELYETDAHSNLIMKGFYKDNSGNDYLSVANLAKNSRLSILLTYANSEDVPNGKGKAKFEITVPTTITKISLDCTTCSSTSSCPLNISNYTSGSEITNISAGSHSVAFKFYDANDTLLYSFTELIHIFANSLTDIWKTKAEYIASDGKSINITDEILKNYSKKIFYIANSTGNDTTGTGSFFKPYKTIQKAVDKIQTINDGTTEYQIKLLDDISATGTGNAVDINPATTLKLIISSVDSNKKIDANKTCRVMNIGENALVTLENVTITNGSELAGGGISVLGTLNLNNSIVTENQSNLTGGGIYVTGTLNVNDGTKITNNTASNCGAGIYVCNGTLNFSGNSEISGNLAQGTGSLNGGGGIYLEESTLTSGAAASVLLKNNKAYKNGGGIFISQKSTANINHFEIAENKANSERANNNYMGGGIYVVADASDSSANASKLSISDSSVYGNEAIYGYGGGIFIDKNCNFYLNRASIIGNATKPNGAIPNPSGIAGNGIYAKNCSMTFDGDITIFENEAIALKGTQITLSDRFEQPTYTILLQPEPYTDGTQILTGEGLAQYTSFKVQNEDWEITSDGKLKSKGRIPLSSLYEVATIFKDAPVASKTYTLETKDDLIYLSTVSQNRTLYGVIFEMKNDIDLENEEFPPISSSSGDRFQGIFDGKNYKISGLKIDSTNDNVGLFGYIKQATIKNLTVEGSVKGKSNVGGIVGNANITKTVIENCVSKVSVSNSSETIGTGFGGICGFAYNGVIIKNCINVGTVKGNASVGGIVGVDNAGTNIQNCANIGIINGNSNVGGLGGNISATANFTNCYNGGTINCTVGDGGSGSIDASPSGNATYSNVFWITGTTSKPFTNTSSTSKVTEISPSNLATLKTNLNNGITDTTFSKWEYLYSGYPTCVKIN